MENNSLSKLINHLFWADAKVWEFVLANDAARNNKKIQQALFHSHMTQDAFVHLWTKTEFELPKNKSYPNAESVKVYADEVTSKMKKYFGNLSTLNLEEKIEVPWSKYFVQMTGNSPAETTLGDTIMQVIMHTTYHRGQINLRLRELEIDPPMVDYIAWIWFNKPKID